MKTLLLTISTTALLLVGQSAMALEQISSENGYDTAARNGRISEAATNQLDMVFAANKASTGFEHISSENGYDAAVKNGWVSTETASAIDLGLMKASFKTGASVDTSDVTSIDYLSKS